MWGTRLSPGCQAVVEAGCAPHTGKVAWLWCHCVRVGHHHLWIIRALEALEAQVLPLRALGLCSGKDAASRCLVLCVPRADGPHPTTHSHLHQHQGTPGLLLCPLWA